MTNPVEWQGLFDLGLFFLDLFLIELSVIDLSPNIHFSVKSSQHSVGMSWNTLKLILATVYWLSLPQEAYAWGLYTHVIYAHYLAFAVPFLDKRSLSVMRRLPGLVMAGACIPDLAVVSKQFSHSHGWGMGQRMLEKQDSDEALALALGYNSHLLIDVLAHQHFVPSFEAKWEHTSLVTHVASEWAMDAYLSKQMLGQTQNHQALPLPHELLQTHHDIMVDTVAHCLGLPSKQVHTSIRRLKMADFALRRSGLPNTIYQICVLRDHEFEHKLAYYVQQIEQTMQAMPQITLGDMPHLHAEHCLLEPHQVEDWRVKCLKDVRLQRTQAVSLFERYAHQWMQHPTT